MRNTVQWIVIYPRSSGGSGITNKSLNFVSTFSTRSKTRADVDGDLVMPVTVQICDTNCNLLYVNIEDM